MSSITKSEPPKRYTSRIAVTPESDFTAEFVQELADLLDTELEDLPDVYEYIDPEALESLFAPTNPGTRRFSGSLTFKYDTYYVTIGTSEFPTETAGDGETEVSIVVTARERPDSSETP